ncbi:MAG: O-antigen ligase family protein [Bryobacteraceae bacterium]
MSLRNLLTWQDVLISVFIGFAFGVPVHHDSPIYIGEMLGVPLCIGLLITGRLTRVIRQLGLQALVIAMPVMYFGYLVSDLVAGTETEQMLKTSARLIFQFTDLLAVAHLLSRKPKRFDWLLVGFALSTCIFGYLDPDSAMWKFSGAAQIDFVMAFLAKRLPRIAGAGLLIATGVLNLILDCRNAAAVAVLAGVIYLVGASAKYVKNAGVLQIVTIVGLVFAALSLTWHFVSSKDVDRQRESSMGRLSEIKVVFKACLRSPLVGYGSDYSSSDLIDELAQSTVDKRGYRNGESMFTTFKGHSEILQTWFEGGALGPVLFVIMLAWAVLGLRALTSEQNLTSVDPVLLTAILLCGWDLLMSPFGGVHRTSNAVLFGAVIIVHSYYRSKEPASQHSWNLRYPRLQIVNRLRGLRPVV